MKKPFYILILLSNIIAAQSVDVYECLKLIDKGKIGEAKGLLQKLEKSKPESEEFLLLDAILTENGEFAAKKYSDFVEKFSDNDLCQIALSRLNAYFYARGQYKKANTYYNQLKKNFPNSKYLAGMKSTKLEDTFKPVEEKQEIAVNENPKQISSKVFSIQVGAFSNIKNAQNLSKKIRAKKYFVRVIEKVIESKKFHVVMVGKYDSIENAEKAVSVINKQFSVNGKIISEDK